MVMEHKQLHRGNHVVSKVDLGCVLPLSLPFRQVDTVTQVLTGSRSFLLGCVLLLKTPAQPHLYQILKWAS